MSWAEKNECEKFTVSLRISFAGIYRLEIFSGLTVLISCRKIDNISSSDG